MNQQIDIKKELVRSIISVVRHKEFYGHVVQQFEKIFVQNPHRIETAAVGRFPGERFIKLIYNEDYFRGLYDEQMAKAKNDLEARDAMHRGRLLASGASEHEILHVVFGHLTLSFPDKIRANVAFDCVVNPNIPDERRHHSWIMPERYGLPNGKNCKWYYDNLKDNEKFKSDMASGAFGVGGIFEYISGSHSGWDSIKDDTAMGEFIKDIIRKAKDNTSADGWGKLGSDIREHIDSMLQWQPPKVPWGKVFRNFCASSEESMLEYTMSRESRRFGTRPGIKKRDRMKIGVIIDTSASITNNEIALFFNEVRWIWRNGAVVHVFEADTDVRDNYEFRGKFRGEVVGRGGTNLEEPLKKVAPMGFDCIVYFTDFEAPRIQSRFRVPVLWVLKDPPDRAEWPCDWGYTTEIDATA